MATRSCERRERLWDTSFYLRQHLVHLCTIDCGNRGPILEACLRNGEAAGEVGHWRVGLQHHPSVSELRAVHGIGCQSPQIAELDADTILAHRIRVDV